MRRPNAKYVGAMAMLVHVVSVRGKRSLSNMLSVQLKAAILLQLPGPIVACYAVVAIFYVSNKSGQVSIASWSRIFKVSLSYFPLFTRSVAFFHSSKVQHSLESLSVRTDKCHVYS